MIKQQQYTEDSIHHFKGLEGVRAKPGMYLGERGNAMVYRCVKEPVDNAYDEYSAGRNSYIELVVDTKNSTYIIADKGQGIPVGVHKTAKISTLTLVLTELHAGGKFNNSAYSTSSGTHGIGVSATNAVSEKFEVWTFRDKVWYYQAFAKGKPTTKVIKANPPKDVSSKLSYSPKSGTILKFTPDQSVVSSDKKTKAFLESKLAYSWLKNLALLNKNLTVTVTYDGTTKTFLNTVGVVKVLNSRVKKLELETLTKPLVYEDEVLSFAIQWTSYSEDTGVSSYVSSSVTRDGGSHLDEFYDALTKALAAYKSASDKYTPKDLRYGVVGVINYKMSGPEFSSQVKDRLVSNLKKDVFNRSLKYFEEYFAAHKSTARKIIKRAKDIKKTKDEFSKLLKNVSQIRKAKGGVLLPTVLSSAKCTPDKRELFIVEGDSASGSAKRARDSAYQEVLKLTGKFSNAIRTPMAKLLKSKSVQNILIAIGYDHKQEDPVKSLRVQRLYFLSDPDPDGPVVGETRVLTPDGKNPTIKQLASMWNKHTQPIPVLSKDKNGKVVEAAAIYPRVTVSSKEQVIVTFDDSTVIRCHPSHKWMLLSPSKEDTRIENISFIQASKLLPGDVLDSNKRYPTVSSIRTITTKRPTDYYCLTVLETGNLFFTGDNNNGIGSSNCHINALLATLIYKLVPSLYDEGRVYVCNAPLFVCYYKGQRYFGQTFQECYSQMPKGSPKEVVQRLKGWGECNPEMLEIIAFNPKYRNLIQLKPVKGKEEQYFLSIMGSDSAARKTLLGV